MSEFCKPARETTATPKNPLPPGACDTHFHIFGPAERYPYAQKRNYTPPDASVADYVKLIRTLGIERQVIVQPSVYGTDNTRTLEAMRELGPTCRGVVVIDAETPAEELRALHDLGVRGVRFNSVTGGSAGVEVLETMAARIAPLGWHIQLFLNGDIYPHIEHILKRLPVDFVIDHMGQTMTDRGIDDPGFKTVVRLIEQRRGWAKITGAYRISSGGPPYSDSGPFARALIEAAPDRVVWGTDWPHPDVKGEMPEDGQLLDLLWDWADDAVQRRRILVDNPAQLYSFDTSETVSRLS
jgi:predicted TIM-barrel fold metal-dependent hydrolase